MYSVCSVIKLTTLLTGGPSLSLNHTNVVHLSLQDIVSLFSHEKCPSCVTCEFADNDCWYVTFVSEESTQKVSF